MTFWPALLVALVSSAFATVGNYYISRGTALHRLERLGNLYAMDPDSDILRDFYNQDLEAIWIRSQPIVRFARLGVTFGVIGTPFTFVVSLWALLYKPERFDPGSIKSLGFSVLLLAVITGFSYFIYGSIYNSYRTQYRSKLVRVRTKRAPRTERRSALPSTFGSSGRD